VIVPALAIAVISGVPSIPLRLRVQLFGVADALGVLLGPGPKDIILRMRVSMSFVVGW